MNSFEKFVSEELNALSRKLIDKMIMEGMAGSREKGELIFNHYSLEFDFKRLSVSIYDDIFIEVQPYSMPVKEFMSKLNLGTDKPAL